MSGKTIPIVMLVLLVTSMLVFAVKIQPVKAIGTITINADGSISPSIAPIYSADNITYTLTGNITAEADGIVIERDNIILNGAGHNIHGTGSGNGIDLSNRTDVTVTDLQIRGFSTAIDASGSSNLTISYNNITENTNGVVSYLLWGYVLSKFVSIVGNNITANNYSGIMMAGLLNSTISENNVKDNGIGIDLAAARPSPHAEWGCAFDSIAHNIVTGNIQGIALEFAGYRDGCNEFFGNEIVNNKEYGVWMYSSLNNTFSENNVSGNGCGLHLEPNIPDLPFPWYIYSIDNTIARNNLTGNSQFGIQLINSSDNLIYNNNFVENAQQVQSNYSTNAWDNGYPSGGNYWSDYSGTDANHDGIGDTAYLIDANNTDRYPMMNPHARLVGDINGDGKVDMRDVGYVARRFMCVPGDPLWDAAADLNGDGKVNMKDIGLIARACSVNFEPAPALNANTYSLSNTGYIAENIVYDSVTGKYWWIFEDRTSYPTVVRMASAASLNGPWIVESNAVISESGHDCRAPFLGQFDGIWYIYYCRVDTSMGISGDIWVKKSSSVNTGYSTTGINNPILTRGSGSAWDSGRSDEPYVFQANGLYYLFYMGQNGYELTGYATSSFPIGPFTKYASNPILPRQDHGWDSGVASLADPFVFKVDNKYYIGVSAENDSSIGPAGYNQVTAIGLYTTIDFISYTYWGIFLGPSGGSNWDGLGVLRGAVSLFNGVYYFPYAGCDQYGAYRLGITTVPSKNSL